MERIRRRIDQIDQKLMTLISDRLRLMDFIRDKKIKAKQPVIDRQRTKYVFDSRLKLAKKLQFREAFAKKLIKVVGKECVKRLKKK